MLLINNASNLFNLVFLLLLQCLINSFWRRTHALMSHLGFSPTYHRLQTPFSKQTVIIGSLSHLYRPGTAAPQRHGHSQEA